MCNVSFYIAFTIVFKKLVKFIDGYFQILCYIVSFLVLKENNITFMNSLLHLPQSQFRDFLSNI